MHTISYITIPIYWKVFCWRLVCTKQYQTKAINKCSNLHICLFVWIKKGRCIFERCWPNNLLHFSIFRYKSIFLVVILGNLIYFIEGCLICNEFCTFDSNSEMIIANISYMLQNILNGLKCIISASDFISKMRHGTLN